MSFFIKYQFWKIVQSNQESNKISKSYLWQKFYNGTVVSETFPFPLIDLPLSLCQIICRNNNIRGLQKSRHHRFMGQSAGGEDEHEQCRTCRSRRGAVPNPSHQRWKNSVVTLQEKCIYRIHSGTYSLFLHRYLRYPPAERLPTLVGVLDLLTTRHEESETDSYFRDVFTVLLLPFFQYLYESDEMTVNVIVTFFRYRNTLKYMYKSGVWKTTDVRSVWSPGFTFFTNSVRKERGNVESGHEGDWKRSIIERPFGGRSEGTRLEPNVEATADEAT